MSPAVPAHALTPRAVQAWKRRAGVADHVRSRRSTPAPARTPMRSDPRSPAYAPAAAPITSQIAGRPVCADTTATAISVDSLGDNGTTASSAATTNTTSTTHGVAAADSPRSGIARLSRDGPSTDRRRGDRHPSIQLRPDCPASMRPGCSTAAYQPKHAAVPKSPTGIR